MFKKLIIGVAMLMLPLNAYCFIGSTSTQIREATSDDLEIAVASTNTIYSNSMNLKQGYAFALMYKATSDGTVNVQMDIEQSDSKPITEGVTDTDWVTPENVATFDTITDENWHIKAFSPLATSYARAKFTGLGSNDASTTMQLKLCKVEA